MDALELVTLRQELEIMKREMQLLRSEPRGDVPSPTASSTPGLGIRAIGELLSDFDGLNGDFLEWERQVKLVCRTYQLEHMASKVLVGSKLKGRAKQWFHSRVEYIEMDLDSLLREMRTVFDSRPNKTARRQRFEARSWKTSETFGEYYYEKIVLANQVPVDEDEIVDYIIDGIPNEQLRNQARIQNFGTAAQLLNAFKKITISSERVSSGSARKAIWTDRRGDRETNIKEKGHPEQQGGEGDCSRTQGRRCFNCQGFGHFSRECPQTRKSDQGCFACGERGHVSWNCPERSSSKRETQMSDNEHRRMVHYVVKRDQEYQPLRLDTQLDTGSAVSFMKASVVPEEYVESNRELSNEYQGLNNSPMVVQGTGNFDIEFDGRKEVDCSILLVPDETMVVPAVLGRDVLSRFECQLTMPSTETDRAENIGREILNVDVCKGIDNKSTLTIKPEVSQQTITEELRDKIAGLDQLEHLKTNSVDEVSIIGANDNDTSRKEELLEQLNQRNAETKEKNRKIEQLTNLIHELNKIGIKVNFANETVRLNYINGNDSMDDVEARQRQIEERQRQKAAQNQTQKMTRRNEEDRRMREEEERRQRLQEEENERRRQHAPSNLISARYRISHTNEIKQRDRDEGRRMREQEERRHYRPKESKDPRTNASDNNEEYRRRMEEERKLQDYVKKNPPVNVSSRSNQSTTNMRPWTAKNYTNDCDDGIRTEISRKNDLE